MQGVERKLVPTDLVRTASFPAVLRLHGQQMSLHPFQAHPGAISEHQSFPRFLFQQYGQKFLHAGEQRQHLVRHFPAHGQTGFHRRRGNDFFSLSINSGNFLIITGFLHDALRFPADVFITSGLGGQQDFPPLFLLQFFLHLFRLFPFRRLHGFRSLPVPRSLVLHPQMIQYSFQRGISRRHGRNFPNDHLFPQEVRRGPFGLYFSHRFFRHVLKTFQARVLVRILLQVAEPRGSQLTDVPVPVIRRISGHPVQKATVFRPSPGKVPGFQRHAHIIMHGQVRIGAQPRHPGRPVCGAQVHDQVANIPGTFQFLRVPAGFHLSAQFFQTLHPFRELAAHPHAQNLVQTGPKGCRQRAVRLSRQIAEHGGGFHQIPTVQGFLGFVKQFAEAYAALQPRFRRLPVFQGCFRRRRNRRRRSYGRRSSILPPFRPSPNAQRQRHYGNNGGGNDDAAFPAPCVPGLHRAPFRPGETGFLHGPGVFLLRLFHGIHQFGIGRKPVFFIKSHQSVHNETGHWRNVVHHLLQKREIFLVLQKNIGRLGSVHTGRRTCQQMVHGSTQSVHVRTEVLLSSQQRFRRGVIRSNPYFPLHVGFAMKQGQAEIHDFDDSVGGQKNIGGLDIPVHKARIPCGVQPAHDIQRQAQHPVFRHTFLRSNQGIQAIALHQLHGNVKKALVTPNGIKLHQIFMGNPRHDPGLPFKTFAAQGIPGISIIQHFQGHFPPQNGILRPEHHTHAAFSQFSGNTIRPHARFYTRQRLAARANGVGVRRQQGNIHGLSARRAIDDVFLLGNHERRAAERESEKRKEEKWRGLSAPLRI